MSSGFLFLIASVVLVLHTVDLGTDVLSDSGVDFQEEGIHPDNIKSAHHGTHVSAVVETGVQVHAIAHECRTTHHPATFVRPDFDSVIELNHIRPSLQDVHAVLVGKHLSTHGVGLGVFGERGDACRLDAVNLTHSQVNGVGLNTGVVEIRDFRITG